MTFKEIDLNLIFTNSFFQIIASAFFGGLFAGLFSNHFESKRRVADKRRDKYYDHRNTIVQIEHELLPSRVNISRDITSLTDSLTNTNEFNKRIVLRFYKLKITTGLSLNLLDIKLINLYAEVFSQFETINNDIDYINQMVISIVEDKKHDRVDMNLVTMYFQFSEYLLIRLKETDQKSLELLAYCKLVLNKNEKKILKKYINDGGQIKSDLSEKSIKAVSRQVTKEENRPHKRNEAHPQFITPFLDLKKSLFKIKYDFNNQLEFQLE
ncbi:MAG: hypothetical protein WA152_01275 [Microgenomates group bacterium]